MTLSHKSWISCHSNRALKEQNLGDARSARIAPRVSGKTVIAVDHLAGQMKRHSTLIVEGIDLGALGHIHLDQVVALTAVDRNGQADLVPCTGQDQVVDWDLAVEVDLAYCLGLRRKKAPSHWAAAVDYSVVCRAGLD